MGTIRVETGGTSNVADVYRWLSDHRGQVVDLDEQKRIALGIPISGARAVIVAAVVQDDTRPGPQLRGTLRALSTADDREPARMIFDVRATGAVDSSTVRELGSGVLQSVTALVSRSEALSTVAA